MTIARALRRLFARVPATGLPPIFTAVYAPAAGRPRHRAVTTDLARASAPAAVRRRHRAVTPDHARVSAPDRPAR